MIYFPWMCVAGSWSTDRPDITHRQGGGGVPRILLYQPTTVLQILQVVMEVFIVDFLFVDNHLYGFQSYD